MKIEIIKKSGISCPDIFYYVYIDGKFFKVFSELKNAEECANGIEYAFLHPTEPEIVYSKEI